MLNKHDPHIARMPIQKSAKTCCSQYRCGPPCFDAFVDLGCVCRGVVSFAKQQDGVTTHH